MTSDIFRREAIEYRDGGRSESEILLMLPGWARWTYQLLIVLLVASLAFIVFGSVSRYVDGPAVIRAQERVPITATLPGIVASVRATSGMRVERGDPLVRFRAADEEAQSASVQREFDAALVRMLANPLDQGARQTLASLRAQKELFEARIAERYVRAPESGTVGDVRVKPGQSVTPGELILSIVREQATFAVVALLPGQQRPLLRKGQPLRLELTGYPYQYQSLTIDTVDDEIIGPQEVRRMLGPEVADSIPVSGPVVVVHASLPRSTFTSDGNVYRYFDGMHATARARLRSERLLTTLLPETRRLTERLP